MENSKFEIRNSKFRRRRSGFTPHLLWGLKKDTNSTLKKGAGFTLVELVIYLAIVSIILVSISYLILDILAGQTKSYAYQEVNQNLRFITNYLVKDIKSAQDIGSLTSSVLILTLPGDDITYHLDSGVKKITRQLGGAEAVDLNTNQVEVTGSFFDLSYPPRAKNIGVHLEINYKNSSNLTDYNASTTADFSVELRGRR